ncbi:hypothetical protein SEVIR_6G152540v4 [Setaria viridis]
MTRFSRRATINAGARSLPSGAGLPGGTAECRPEHWLDRIREHHVTRRRRWSLAAIFKFDHHLHQHIEIQQQTDDTLTRPRFVHCMWSYTGSTNLSLTSSGGSVRSEFSPITPSTSTVSLSISPKARQNPDALDRDPYIAAVALLHSRRHASPMNLGLGFLVRVDFLTPLASSGSRLPSASSVSATATRSGFSASSACVVRRFRLDARSMTIEEDCISQSLEMK